ncbi:MAG: hypothetical protein FWG87_13175 [Defluviitaleaceae bacterium]|nr:hypothetical protein [Defluviitaleaceae bacterium]
MTNNALHRNILTNAMPITPEWEREMADMLDDQYLLALANERERNSNGVTYSFEEVLAERGLTLADIDSMEDVEIE